MGPPNKRKTPYYFNLKACAEILTTLF